MTRSTSLADQFNAAVKDYMDKCACDFGTAWEACKKLESGLWNDWQNGNRAANEAGQQPDNGTAQARAEALAEFTRRVNERMANAGENYGAAWAFVQQTQPRLYVRMNGDFTTDKELEKAGNSLPPFRKN